MTRASTPAVRYREANKSDIPAMAHIRAAEWGGEEYWKHRIAGYLNCELHPQHALIPRVIYIALERDELVGFIAGHLTRRFGCDGELEWINVIPERRRSGVASELLRLLWAWFAEQKARRICVDVDPGKITARKFYKRHGASDLNPHWLVWDDVVIQSARND
jgi:ribosomal protein S18 acetylase RimI-like enzyme